MSKVTGSWMLVLAAGLATAGCADSRSGSAAPVVRDSAGVRIVENPDVEPSSGGGVAWALAEVPVLNIGALDAAPEYQFHQVRGVVRLSDGRIVVADAGSSQLRWYDSGGVHVATAGREGDGPGEFGSLAGVAVLPGDSIVTFDDRQRRLSVFDDSSTFVRSNPLAAEGHPGMEYPVFGGAMADGTLLMVGRVLQIEGMKEGPIRSPMTVYRYAPDGRMLDSLGTFHGWEALVVIREQDQFVAMAIRDRPFGRNTSVAPLPDGFVVGTPVAYEYQVHAPASVLRAIVRLERANAPVTSGDIEAYVESQLEDIEDPNAIRTRRQELSELTYPETMPAFGYPILADRGGNVWVPDFMAGDESRTWTVFDRGGRRLGSVATPADLRVFDVGDDFLLGVWRDELGVEYVRGYGLIKP